MQNQTDMNKIFNNKQCYGLDSLFPKGTCAESLVLNVVLWELTEPLRGRAWKETLGSTEGAALGKALGWFSETVIKKSYDNMP